MNWPLHELSTRWAGGWPKDCPLPSHPADSHDYSPNKLFLSKSSGVGGDPGPDLFQQALLWNTIYCLAGTTRTDRPWKRDHADLWEQLRKAAHSPELCSMTFLLICTGGNDRLFQWNLEVQNKRRFTGTKPQYWQK